MKKNIWAALLCIIFATTLLVSGCSSSGTVSKTTGDSAGKGQETSGKQLEDSESVPEEGILVGSDSFLNEGESEEEIEEEIEEEPEEKSGAELGEEPEEPGSGEDGSVSAKVSGQETKKEKTPAGAAAGTVSDDTASKKETAEAEAKEKQPEEKQEKGKTKEAAAKEDQPKDGSREEGQKENKEKEEKDILKDLQAGLEGEYIPDGFEPEGNYVLIYDSGYTVKTRYSKVGLTYYWESEEFFFKLNKDLPDMKAYVAHMLFNTAEPMSDPGEEVFPYDESYVLYVDLDNGNSYQIAKYSLDRTGRIFVRELFESFRQRFEGTF